MCIYIYNKMVQTFRGNPAILQFRILLMGSPLMAVGPLLHSGQSESSESAADAADTSDFTLTLTNFHRTSQTEHGLPQNLPQIQLDQTNISATVHQTCSLRPRKHILHTCQPSCDPAIETFRYLVEMQSVTQLDRMVALTN